MKALKDWGDPIRDGAVVRFAVDGQHQMSIAVLEHDLIRVSLQKTGNWRQGRSWSVAPDGDVPWNGRARADTDGFSCPDFRFDPAPERIVIKTAALRLTVKHPLQFEWAAWIDGDWRVFAQDRRTGAVQLGVRNHAHAHFLHRFDGDRVFGLGEKTGPLERSGKRFEMRNLDAMGYDAQNTDPLYKHIPFTLTRTGAAGCYSLFYDNLATAWFDLGNELDNYHLPYRSYRAADGDLDYYMRWSPDMLGLVRGQAHLTGGTAFAPRWSLGYSGSTMAYTDAENAQDQLAGFVDEIAAHDIPCDSFQLSSGYSSIGSKRYVFTWNREKLPDPKAMVRNFTDAGLHLIANIKPCLLQDHPLYQQAELAGLFVRDSETGAPERSVFWDDEGSHLDFTNPETVAWWQKNLTSQLLDYGIECTWNDNNEYEVWDHHAQCAGFGNPIDVGLIRPLQPLLMTRASYEAQINHLPNKRPFLITRSAAPGSQRYAQTWTGDNRTNWETLRWNIRMGLGLSLSGFFNIGHDVGGFAGPRPGPELFLRWVQNGIFHPRFTIHSWNDDGSVNEPWMYDEVLDDVRGAIRLRYRLLPYLYTLLWQASTQNEPMLRPTFLDHPDDDTCWEDTDDFMLGRDILVATVVEPGARSRRVYLPQNTAGWWDFRAGVWHAGGQHIDVPVDQGTIPMFVRAGAVIAMVRGANRADNSAAKGLDLAVFPQPASCSGVSADTSESVMFEDDGESRDSSQCVSTFSLRNSADEMGLKIARTGARAPQFRRARILLPQGETRALTMAGNAVVHGSEITLEDQ
ncbi:MAG: glycoside hydrolase family 31 protein [Marinosulfonomonas sp.]|nr:glycoside hydrolase family 31 protein [Marinosulfonomonas sp.]